MAAYSDNEVYKAWIPTYRDSLKGPTAAPEESGLRVKSGLTQQVVEREEERRRELGVKGRELDHKTVKKVGNSSLRNSLARIGDFIFIVMLVALIVLIIFLGVFFTYK